MRVFSSVLVLLIFCVFLTGCSLPKVPDGLQSVVDTFWSKDTSDTGPGSILSPKDVYSSYDAGSKTLDLSDKNLTELPDLCSYAGEKILDAKTINLSDNRIQEVNTDLSCFTDVQTLDLSDNEITSFVGVGVLSNLVLLILDNNGLEYLGEITGLESLKKLSAAYNKIKDLGDLSELSALERLNLSNNLLESLTGMKAPEGLEELFLTFNKLKDVESLEDLKELQNLNFLGLDFENLDDQFFKKRNDINNEYFDGRLPNSNELQNGNILVN